MGIDKFGAVMGPPLSLRELTGGRQQYSTDHEVIEDYGLGRKLMLVGSELTPHGYQEQRCGIVATVPFTHDF
jgi:hypothetical protein